MAVIRDNVWYGVRMNHTFFADFDSFNQNGIWGLSTAYIGMVIESKPAGSVAVGHNLFLNDNYSTLLPFAR